VDRSTPVNLTGAALRYVVATNADFSEAILDGANFQGADLAGAKLPKDSPA
jgi:uncharacterized protein YjbI with pentapeptide repeats